MEALWQNEIIRNSLWFIFYIMHSHACALDCVPGYGPPCGSLIGLPCGSVTGSVIVPARIAFQLELPLCACTSRDSAPLVPARFLAHLLPRQYWYGYRSILIHCYLATNLVLHPGSFFYYRNRSNYRTNKK